MLLLKIFKNIKMLSLKILKIILEVNLLILLLIALIVMLNILEGYWIGQGSNKPISIQGIIRIAKLDWFKLSRIIQENHSKLLSC